MCVFNFFFQNSCHKTYNQIVFSLMHCTIVLVKVTFPWNLFVPKLQSNSNFPSWISLICVLKLPLVEKFLSQNLHLNDSFPSCIKEMCAVEKASLRIFCHKTYIQMAFFFHELHWYVHWSYFCSRNFWNKTYNPIAFFLYEFQ